MIVSCEGVHVNDGSRILQYWLVWRVECLLHFKYRIGDNYILADTYAYLLLLLFVGESIAQFLIFHLPILADLYSEMSRFKPEIHI